MAEDRAIDATSTVEKPLKITLLGSGWSSSKGGLSTLNRELAIQLTEHAKVDVSFLVPEGACEFQEIKEASSFGISVVEAKGRTAYDRLDWLSTPPKDHNMEIVVGHGVKLGRQVQFIRDSARFPNCKWVQVVHTAPEDLGRFKSYTEPISKGQRKHQDEVELCKLADLVVPVGPRLKNFYSSYLRRHKTEQDVFTVTPGLFDREFEDLVEKQKPNEDGEFKVLLFGRGDDEDFELKGYNIAAQAFSDPRMKKDFCLMFVGAPQGKEDEVTQRLVQCGIAKEQLFVREFIANREGIKDILCEADLAIMPSKSEGFGLVGLEALSAGLPILVGSRSGFAKALEKIKVPSGESCIVYSDDPTMWADAIVAVRDRHKLKLEEIKALRESYGQIYSWRRQCEDLANVMQKMIHGYSDTEVDLTDEDKHHFDTERRMHQGRVYQPYQRPMKLRSLYQKNEGVTTRLSELDQRSEKTSGDIPMLASCKDFSSTKINTQQFDADMNKELYEPCPRLQFWPMKLRRISQQNEEDGVIGSEDNEHNGFGKSGGSSVFTSDQDKESPGVKPHLAACLRADEPPNPPTGRQTLFVEENEVTETNEEAASKSSYGIPNSSYEQGFQPIKVELSVKPQNLNAEQLQIFVDSLQQMDGLNAFVQNLRRSYNVLENALTKSGLEITMECPNLDSLEKLLNDHETGRLNEVAERNLVTEEIKMVLCLETVRLETVFKEHSYLEILRISRLPFNQTKPNWRKNTERNDVTSKVQKALRGDLHRASASGDYDTVKMLLKYGEGVDQRDQFSLTPLHLACWYGRESVVRLLLEHGANVNAVDRFQRTPFQKAERQSHQNIKLLLQERNASQRGKQPLSLGSLAQKAFLQVDRRTGLNLLQAAVFEGMYETVFDAHVLVQDFVKEMDSEIVESDLFPGMTAVEILNSLDIKGKSYIKIGDLYRDKAAIIKTFTELHWSAERDDPEMVVELCLNDGIDVNITAKNNRTSLRWVCASASGLLIETLIDLGAEKNVQSSETKSSPLLLAASWNNYMAVRTLLDHGADANIQDINDVTPLHASVSRGFCKISQLLVEKGSNVNLRTKDSRTPLYIAVKRNDLHLIKLLLENGADLGMEYKEDPEERVYLVRGKDKGKPAWHYLLVDKHLLGLFLKKTNGGNVDVADFGAVLRSGWGKDPPDGTIDQVLKEKSSMFTKIRGETLLHVASKNNSTEAIDLMVKNGAWDCNPRDELGFTPLHIAAINGNMQAVEKLVDLGADASQAEAVADFAHVNEEYGIESFLKSKIVFLPERKKTEQVEGTDEVELAVRVRNVFREAGSISREVAQLVVESISRAINR